MGNGVDAEMVLDWFGVRIGCGGEDATACVETTEGVAPTVWDSAWLSELP